MIAASACSPSELAAFIERRLKSGRSLAERHARRRRFSPSLAYGRHFGPPLPTARQAAVMVLLEPRDHGWSIPLTVRPAHLPDHPGQICLPGGRLEQGETTRDAAEREFCEELGQSKFPGRTLGALQPIYVYNSDFYLTPFIAVAHTQPHYVPCPQEVETIIHLPLKCLADDQHCTTELRSRGTVIWHSPGITHDSHHVWGATAIILGEVAALLQHTL